MLGDEHTTEEEKRVLGVLDASADGNPASCHEMKKLRTKAEFDAVTRRG